VGDEKQETTVPVSNLVVENSLNYVLTAKVWGGGVITRKYKCPLFAERYETGRDMV
jgi:hypothetical protein